MGSLHIPEIIPAIVLRDVVFFPQSILPLYIFEEHYRKMLETVIKGDRMFTVVNALPEDFSTNSAKTLNETVTLGYLKACQTYEDGTSMVLLSGVCRVAVQEYLTNAPYLNLKVAAINEPPADPFMLESLRNQTLSLLEKIHLEGGDISGETLDSLRQIDIPQHFVDHAAASFLKNTATTQILLKCCDPVQRYSKLLEHLQLRYQRIELINSIVGHLSPEDISKN